MNEENKIIRVCRICNINVAKPKNKRCQACISKSNNEHLNTTNYFKQYYEINKVEFLQHCKETYRKKNPEYKKKGRPPTKKEPQENDLKIV